MADIENSVDGEASQQLAEGVVAPDQLVEVIAQKPPEKKTEKKKKGKRKGYKDSAGGKNKKGRVHIDVLGEIAMTNALYICHSAQDLLLWRGYFWPLGNKKQKKKGKK